MRREIEVLKVLRDNAYEAARYYKERNDREKYHTHMRVECAYDMAINILTDNDFLDDLCKIWDIV